MEVVQSFSVGMPRPGLLPLVEVWCAPTLSVGRKPEVLFLPFLSSRLHSFPPLQSLGRGLSAYQKFNRPVEAFRHMRIADSIAMNNETPIFQYLTCTK